nr:MAG TPA: hypothetical protein [Caudoviricetes sp.]
MKIHARFLKVVFLRPNLQKWRYEGYGKDNDERTRTVLAAGHIPAEGV